MFSPHFYGIFTYMKVHHIQNVIAVLKLYSIWHEKLILKFIVKLEIERYTI